MRFISLTLVLLLPLPALMAQQLKKKNSNQSPEGPVALNAGPMTIAGEITGDRVSDSNKQGDWPAIANGRDGDRKSVV